MSIGKKVFVVAATVATSFASLAHAGGKPETVATLVCAPSVAGSPTVAAGCL